VQLWRPQVRSPRRFVPPSCGGQARRTGSGNHCFLPGRSATTSAPAQTSLLDVIKSLGIEYANANPAPVPRSARIDHQLWRATRNPEPATCCHEESSVGMAHGYAKIEASDHFHGSRHRGNAACLHGNLQRLFATCTGHRDFRQRAGRDRSQKLLLNGPTPAQGRRRNIRDFTKWDDAPGSLQHFAESFVRAYKIAMTPPWARCFGCQWEAAGRADRREQPAHPETHHTNSSGRVIPVPSPKPPSSWSTPRIP